MVTHRASASLYTEPLSAVNGLSRLTTTSNGQAFSNRPITFESNRDGGFEFELNLEALQVPSYNITLNAGAHRTTCSFTVLQDKA